MSTTHMLRMLQFSANKYTRNTILKFYLDSSDQFVALATPLCTVLWSCIKVNKVWIFIICTI